MPIDYKKYPKNWKSEIRPRILKRAENKCECCGLENYSFVQSFKKNDKTVWKAIKDGQLICITKKVVKVILTIAHLDHDATNHDVKDERLKAMCQLCHLRYDAEEKVKRRKIK